MSRVDCLGYYWPVDCMKLSDVILNNSLQWETDALQNQTLIDLQLAMVFAL